MINRYGCHFCCMLRIAELTTKKEIKDNDVIELAKKAKKIKGWDGNPAASDSLYLNDPAAVCNLALEHLKTKRKIEQVGKLENNEMHRWGEFAYTRGREWDFSVFDWQTENGGKHFTLCDYDPNPKVKLGLANKLIFYKIKSEGKK